MGARKQLGIGLSYQPAIGYTAWRNWFLGIDSGLLKSLKIRPLESKRNTFSTDRIHLLFEDKRLETDADLEIVFTLIKPDGSMGLERTARDKFILCGF
jgi:hypothetical protein